VSWSTYFLVCFVVGIALSTMYFLLGGVHGHALGGHHGAPIGPNGIRIGGSGRGPSASPLNLVTLAAFLTWFGGIGYLLTRFAIIWLVFDLLIATASGLAGAFVVFLFLTRVLISSNENLEAADFEMAGVLGRISSPIREGGVGEIIYSQAGTRRASGARSENGQPIAEGTEVIVTRYEHGIVYVRRWSEVAGDELSARS
jgi:membrane protein implicated in regulation of membrane protease activity